MCHQHVEPAPAAPALQRAGTTRPTFERSPHLAPLPDALGSCVRPGAGAAAPGPRQVERGDPPQGARDIGVQGPARSDFPTAPLPPDPGCGAAQLGPALRPWDLSAGNEAAWSWASRCGVGSWRSSWCNSRARWAAGRGEARSPHLPWPAPLVLCGGLGWPGSCRTAERRVTLPGLVSESGGRGWARRVASLGDAARSEETRKPGALAASVC